MSQDNRRKPRNEQKAPPSPQPYQKNPPLWKATIIQFLRGTIGVLENTVVKLETAQSPTTEKKPHFLERVLWGWDRFLQTLRLFLPSNVSNNVSDPVLTGILVVVAVVIVGTTTFIFTSKPVEVAILPPVEEVPPLTPSLTTLPEAIPTPEPQPIPTLEPEIIPEPQPIPTPEPELTPEQALIASIENQLGEIIVPLKSNGDKNISANLIKSIKANLRSSDLIITISDDWYTLEPSQQQQLATDILQRSQELDFTHLQLVDSQNRLVARSPVVGNEMVIFSQHSAVISQ